MRALTEQWLERPFQVIEAFFASFKICCVQGNYVAKAGKMDDLGRAKAADGNADQRGHSFFCLFPACLLVAAFLNGASMLSSCYERKTRRRSV